jgi:hypothetical protein
MVLITRLLKQRSRNSSHRMQRLRHSIQAECSKSGAIGFDPIEVQAADAPVQ